jgi:hypothetical protein
VNGISSEVNTAYFSHGRNLRTRTSTWGETLRTGKREEGEQRMQRRDGRKVRNVEREEGRYILGWVALPF